MKNVTINRAGQFVLRNHGQPKTTLDMKSVVVSGKAVFEMKDTHGMPFSLVFMKLEANPEEALIDWVELIETARAHGWWDYQTYDSIVEGFVDSGAWPDKREIILAKIRAYMVMYPLERGTESASQENVP